MDVREAFANCLSDNIFVFSFFVLDNYCYLLPALFWLCIKHVDCKMLFIGAESFDYVHRRK